MTADPYLAVTLDAKRRIAQVARALDQPHPGTAGSGLLELLEDVWRRKDPAVSALVLAACFGPDPRVAAVLVAFGFLTPVGEAWELCAKETDRLLSTHRQRVAAGKARAAEAGRSGGAFTSGLPAADQRAASGGPAGAPAADQLLQPAASSQQPAAEKEEDLPEVAALRNGWNTLTSPPLPRWTPKSKLLTRLAVAGLKRRPLEEWLAVFQRIEGSPKLRGEDPSLGGWKADAAWALRAEGNKQESAQTVLDGKWDPPRARTANEVLDFPERRERRETAEEIEAANRRSEEVINGG